MAAPRLRQRLLAGLVLCALLQQLPRCSADGAAGSAGSDASADARLQQLQGEVIVLQQRLAALQGAAAVLAEPTDAEQKGV